MVSMRAKVRETGPASWNLKLFYGPIRGPRTLLIRGGSNVPVENRSNAPATISARCGDRQFIIAARESGRDLLNLLGGQDLLDLIDFLIVRGADRVQVRLGDLVDLV